MQSKDKKLSRDSNIELLRLICMLFITIHHIIVHGLHYVGYPISVVDTSSIVCTILESFVIIAVNCFIIISGYYGIRCKWKGFIHLYLLCAFYSILLYTISTVLSGNIDAKKAILSFFPFRDKGLWFIPAYIGLYLLSPLLNTVIENINKKKYVIILILFSIITFYYGYLWKSYINRDGYNTMNFIFLYFIGRFLYLHVNLENFCPQKMKCNALCVYIGCSVIISGVAIVLTFLTYNSKIVSLMAFPYNSPLVIISSIAFFLLFRYIHLQSRFINQIAISTLAIYLIQENKNTCHYLYSFVYQLKENSSNGYNLFWQLFLLTIVIMVGSILIDRVRIIILSPIERRINRINVESKFSLFIDKILSFIK